MNEELTAAVNKELQQRKVIRPFSLSFAKWRQYFWGEFDAIKGPGGAMDDVNPQIAAELQEAYNQSLPPDDEDLMDRVFSLQLDTE